MWSWLLVSPTIKCLISTSIDACCFFEEFYNLKNVTSNFFDLAVPPFKIIVRSWTLL